MGRVLDVAVSFRNSISVAMGEKNVVYVWGYYLGQCIRVPKYTPLKHLHDPFAFYSPGRIMYQPLIVCEEPTEASVIDCLWNAFNDPITSDLIIKVQGKPIHVHKAILKIRCQYFRTMFQDNWAENTASDVSIDTFSYEVYRSFLKYLYTDKIDPVSDSELGKCFLHPNF